MSNKNYPGNESFTIMLNKSKQLDGGQASSVK